MGNLTGQTVVVVGGSSGIGLGVAKLASQHGAHVVIASRTESRLEAAKQEIGSSVDSYVFDVTDSGSHETFFSAVGNFDHLVFTSHGSPTEVLPGIYRDIVDLDIDACREFMEAKFWGPMLASRVALEHISPQGSIAFTSGCASRVWLEKHGIMAAVNCAIEGFVKKAAHEYGPVRVNAIVPSLTKTPTFDELDEEEKQAYYKYFGDRLPVGEVASSEDVAEAYIFAMTAKMVTGSWIDIDGGNNVW